MFEENIPTNGKKTPHMPKKITKIRLRNIALYYLKRYESSVENLRKVLKTRIFKYKKYFPEYNVNDALLWVEEVIQELQDLKYIDDNRYAEIKIDSYLAAGKPARYIKTKLLQKGITENIIDCLLKNKDFSPFDAAMKFAQKKHIGPFCQNEELRKQNKQKDLRKLINAGFEYETALEVLNFQE